MLDKIRASFAQAGRADHAQCGALDGATMSNTGEKPVVIELGGEMVEQRTIVRVGGAPCELQARSFAAFLRLALEHQRDVDAWLTHYDLSIAKAPEVPKRIRDALNPAMPDQLDVLETRYGGRIRLLRSATVKIDRAALAGHPDPRIQKLLATRGKSAPPVTR